MATLRILPPSPPRAACTKFAFWRIISRRRYEPGYPKSLVAASSPFGECRVRLRRQFRPVHRPREFPNKARLGIPDLDHSKSAVLDSLRSRESKRGYRHAMDEFIQWYCSEPRLSFNKVVVTRFRIFLENRNLASGTINGRLAAVRRLAYEAADAGLLSPELAAGIRRVKGVKKLGVRLGNWLTAEESRRIWQFPPPDTLKGKRDRAILAVLLGCGLGDASWPIWSSRTCSNAKNTGPSSISSARAATFTPFYA